MENGHLDEGDDSMLKDWRADGSKENNKDIAQMLSPFGEKKVEPKKKTKETDTIDQNAKKVMSSDDYIDLLAGINPLKPKEVEKGGVAGKMGKVYGRSKDPDFIGGSDRAYAKILAGNKFTESKKKPIAADENTQYFSINGKLLGTGVKGKKLQETEINKDDFSTPKGRKGRKELLSRYKKRKEVSNDYVDDDGKEGREPVDKSVWETWLEKEGDGAGNTGVNSTDTVGVYNARYSDKDGRYKDQEKDTDKEGDEKDDGRRSRD